VQGESNPGKGLCFHPLLLYRNSRKLCGICEITLKVGDFPLCPSHSYKLKLARNCQKPISGDRSSAIKEHPAGILRGDTAAI
jgi:hypothetical protein